MCLELIVAGWGMRPIAATCAPCPGGAIVTAFVLEILEG